MISVYRIGTPFILLLIEKKRKISLIQRKSNNYEKKMIKKRGKLKTIMKKFQTIIEKKSGDF